MLIVFGCLIYEDYKNEQLEEKYPLPAKIFSDYYVDWIPKNEYELEIGIYKGNSEKNKAIISFPEGTLMNYCSSSDRYIVLYVSSNKPEKNISVFGNDSIYLSDYKIIDDNTYVISIVLDTQNNTSVRFKDYKTLESYCKAKDIELSNWKRFNLTCCPPVDINEIVRYFEK